jgi:hypothetical protein
MLRDARLSPEATGVLVFILSHPPDWNFTLEWLQKQRGISRKLAQHTVRETLKAGYCKRWRGKRPDGTWRPYEYTFTDDPQVPNGPVDYEPRDQKPRGGKRTSTKKGKRTKKEEVFKEDPRVGGYARDDGRGG